MIHLSPLQFGIYCLMGVVSLWLLRRIVPVLWRIAKILPRLAFRLGVVAAAGFEIYLLISRPEVFAFEFAVIAVLAIAWRHYETVNGYSPLIKAKRFVKREFEPSPLEELVEKIEMVPVKEHVLVASQPATSGEVPPTGAASPLDSQLDAFTGLWSPEEMFRMARQLEPGADEDDCDGDGDDED